jgi:hypothetical protein
MSDGPDVPSGMSGGRSETSLNQQQRKLEPVANTQPFEHLGETGIQFSAADRCAFGDFGVVVARKHLPDELKLQTRKITRVGAPAPGATERAGLLDGNDVGFRRIGPGDRIQRPKFRRSILRVHARDLQTGSDSNYRYRELGG